jgi:hypothetical protein
VAATGFLPGVLSFLCALSHLERVAHRPTTCSSNFNHLSHLERVLYKLANKPHAVQHCVATTTNGENRHGLSNRLSNDRMVSRLWLGDRDSTHRLDLFRQRMSRLSRNQHRLSPKSTHRLLSVTSCPRRGRFRLHGSQQDVRAISEQIQAFLLVSGSAEVGRVHAQKVEGRMEEEPPTWLISAILFACVWVDTCHPCNCMHSFSMRSFHLEVACPSKKELRIKHIIHMSFGIILKYYSPRT